MSRSYKKNPIVKIKFKGAKKLANHRIRRLKLDSFKNKSASYKKYYPQYDVCDWIIYWDWYKAIKDYRNPNSYIREQFSNEKEFNKYWYKSVIMK